MSTILGEEGSKKLLLGNEAIARGAIEAGVNLASAYPGTPSTEILETLSLVAKKLGLYVEWSVNEKTALEVALGGSLSGLRAMVAMKHVGLNVASDTFMSIGYSGVKGGLVLVSADDPNCYSSQNEQDNRIYGLHAYVPILEPSDAQEAKDLTKKAFELSEKFGSIYIVRTTTRISHTRGKVVLGKINIRRFIGKFYKDPSRWTLLPVNARRLRKEAIKRIEKISKFNEDFEYNFVKDGEWDIGIITSGVAYNYVMEAINILKLNGKIPILKLTTTFPIPKSKIKSFVSKLRSILIVEELEPFLETQIRSIGVSLSIHGKDLIPINGELNVERVLPGILNFLKMNGTSISYKLETHNSKLENKIIIPNRPPVFCPGCPHRATFYELKLAVAKTKHLSDVVFTGDIGCYTLGYYSPFRMVDTTFSMGSSIGIANGIAHSTDQLVVAVIGDSTFFHSGIPGLVNTVYNNAPILIVILDNSVTAMTGNQPHPGTGYNILWQPTTSIKIEDIARAVGVKHVDVTDPYNVHESIEKIYRALKFVIDKKKPAVIVSRRACALFALSLARKRRQKLSVYKVVEDRCTGCMLCVNAFACPAISIKNKKVVINPELCTGCGVCAEICPFNAIVKEDENHD